MIARKDIDKRLANLEKRLAQLYSDAGGKAEKDWKAYMERSDEKADKLLKAIDDAETPKEKADATKAYIDHMQYRTLQNKRYRELTEAYAHQLAETDKIAAAYINNELPAVYAASYNGSAAGVEDSVGAGVSFTTLNPHTVKNLASQDKLKLPYRKVNGKKVENWASKEVNKRVLQGIVQGDSVQKIAKSLEPVMEKDKVAAIRTARTAFTGAENQGVYDCMEEADELGIVMGKKWISIADALTRESHLMRDGTTIAWDEEFADGLMFPGDANGDPEEVYNCRCGMEEIVFGFRKANGGIEKINRVDVDRKHSQKIYEEKQRRAEEQEEKERKKAERNKNKGDDEE